MLLILFATTPFDEGVANLFATYWLEEVGEKAGRDERDAARLERIQSDLERAAEIELQWAPTSRFEATLYGSSVEIEGIGTSLFAQLDPSPLGEAIGIRSSPDNRTSVDEPTETFIRAGLASLTLDYRPDWFDVKSRSCRTTRPGPPIASSGCSAAST